MILLIATDAVTVGTSHPSTEFVKDLKAGFVAFDAELALELDRRHALRMSRNQICGPKPDREWCMGFLHDRPSHQASLFPTVSADLHMWSGLDPKRLTNLAAALADKAIRPADGFEVCGAGDVIGKELLELGKRAGEWEIVGVEHGPSFLARILHDVRVCVNRISMVRSRRSVTISPWSILLNIIASGSLSTQIRRAGHGDTAN